ncbi:hypothetical protein F2P56_007338 [Juglans regia]|uniref:Uncharacterized protein n=2 Tax=Juglans regia TaxID=51240 RepID=A0A834D337_JUGRE|nr:probable carboxylesterase 15 [Juglans regia]KAF5475540.1 hypothetical protein F2P56_007338 [Juglans regia]
MFDIIAFALASATTTPPYVVDECRGVLVYSDGSIVYSAKLSFDVPIHDDDFVLWKDVLFNAINNLQLRLYKPTVVASSSSSTSSSKLPIFYYIYGGDFSRGLGRLSKLSPGSGDDTNEDDFMAVKWLQAQAVLEEHDIWLTDMAETPTQR